MYYGDYFDYDWMTYVGGSPKSGIVAKVMKIMPRMYGNEDHKIALYFPKNWSASMAPKRGVVYANHKSA